MLTTPLLHLTPTDVLTLNQAYEHIFVCGASGSGKTTSSLSLIIRALFRQGAGALFLCVKTDEAQNIYRHARATNREDDIILVSPTTPDPFNKGMLWRINILDYLVKQSTGSAIGMIEEVVNLLSTLTTLVQGTGSLKQEKDFWNLNGEELIRNCITLILLSQSTLSFESTYQLIMSAPKNRQEAEDTYFQEQERDKFFWSALHRARKHATTPQDKHALAIAERYWLVTQANLADRTRSSIFATLTSVLDIFLHGYLYDLFCTETTLTPEMSVEGKIIILDMPVHGEYGHSGRVAQLIFKHLWQRAVMRRPIHPDSRPLMLVADEAQEVVSPSDYTFLAVARSAKTSVIYATQSINAIFARIGAHERDSAEALLGLFNTFIFLSNADPITNNFASQKIGLQDHTRQSWHVDSIGQLSISGHARPEFIIPPYIFSQLKKGGAPDFVSEAIVFQNGRIWANGTPVLRVLFPQQLDDLPTALPLVSEVPQEDEVVTFLVLLMSFIEQFLMMRHNPALLVSHAEESYALSDSMSTVPAESLPIVTLNSPRDVPSENS